MAIYHLSVKPVQRSKGRSATAAAAYRSGIRITDDRTGETHDYTRRKGVIFSEIITPDGSKIDRKKLWNMAEESERRKDGTTAREYELALPSELDESQRKDLALEFGKMIASRHGVAVDIAIHAPTKDGDQRNHHAHILATTRRLENGKLTAKSDFDLSDRDRKKKNLPGRKTELEYLREEWANLVNHALSKTSKKARVTHLSLKAQGISRPPTIHVGPTATAMERKGIPTERGDLNRTALNAPARKIFEELDQLREQESGISEARTRYSQEKARRIIEEEERIKNYELEILEERERTARGEERARVSYRGNYIQTSNQGTFERAGEQESARDQSQSGTDRLAAGSDRVARSGGEFTEQTEVGNGSHTETRTENQPDQAEYEILEPASSATGSRPEEYGTSAGEFGRHHEQTFEQGSTGSLQSGQGRDRSAQQAMGKAQGAGEKSQFTVNILELEKRILWLTQEYRNIIDLLAMVRKGGRQRQSEQDVESPKEAPRRPRM